MDQALDVCENGRNSSEMVETTLTIVCNFPVSEDISDYFFFYFCFQAADRIFWSDHRPGVGGCRTSI